MKSLKKKTKKMKLLKKFHNHYIAQCNYIKYYKKYQLDAKLILLESQHGKEINGNIYYIICELLKNEKYKEYKLNLSVNKQRKKEIKKFLREKDIKRIKLLEVGTAQYFKAISKAKILINDNTFLPFFIKKEGQIYLNTWHGTPLKCLGKKIKDDLHNIGNTQKNFVAADYMLYPNEYTKERILEDYMIKNLAKNTAILEGYPRNTVFFDENQRKFIRDELKLTNKQVIAYMPTWRGNLDNKNTKEQGHALNTILDEIEQELSDKQILYVNVHPIENAKIDYSRYTKIRPFPSEYETYEFLNIADVLVTDYSSVFFDFVNTKKKIILYPYDKEQYLKERGLYINLEELPFPIVYDTEDLIKEVSSEKKYDDTEFIKKFCQYDNKNATKRICERVILNKSNGIKEEQILGNGKENVFIYPGGLEGNGITAALSNLLNGIDKNKRNYYLLVDAKVVAKNKDKLSEMSQYIDYFGMKGKINLTVTDKIYYMLYAKKKIKFIKFIKKVKEKYELEVKRVLADIDVNTIIQYSGYSYKKILLCSAMNCNRVIYVHSNMMEEINTRHNQREEILKYAYNKYDYVVAITEYIANMTSKFVKEKNKKKISVAKNFINYKEIKEKSNHEIVIDATTEMNVTQEQLIEILNSKNKKFINVGRFSDEKGQERLIRSFTRLWQEDKSIYLILMGGHGKLFNIFLKQIETLPSKEHIIIIKSISNPFPIIKKCNYFVLSSLYEGFGLVLAEADILNLPVISTNIGGPRRFMKANGGTLVENTEAGIYKGMKMLLNGEIEPMHINYEKYNEEAREQFEKIFK